MNKLEKYQSHLIEMLKSFQNFCQQNELEFFLVGGSALGAYRHNGFIPWDDDVDIAMLRGDFEKMERCMKSRRNTLNDMVYSPVENSIIPEAPIGHLYDMMPVNGKIEHAPKIDIHPLDGVPKRKVQQKLQNLSALVYYLGVYHLPVKNRGKAIRFVSKVLFLVIPDSIWKSLIQKSKSYFTQWDPEKSCRLCSLFGVTGYRNEVMPREWIYPLKKRLFGQYKFFVPGDAEHYLRRLYGEWRELPSKEKRVPAHDGFLYFEEVSQ